MFKKFIGIVLLVSPLLVGFLSRLVTEAGTREWYPLLSKPPLTPPGWLFGPVWTVLYILMGIAALLVWHSELLGKRERVAIIAFLAQLALNFLWSFLFFGERLPLAALIEIVILWIAILVTLICFFRISTLAGALMLPYLLWVSFASYLSAGFWWLNR